MPIIQLKRPDGSAVYVNSAAVQSFAEIPSAELVDKHAGGTRISFGGGHQDVQEKPEIVASMITAVNAAQSMTIVPTTDFSAQEAAALTIDTMKNFAQGATEFQSVWPSSLNWLPLSVAPDPNHPKTKSRPAKGLASNTGSITGIAPDPARDRNKIR